MILQRGPNWVPAEYSLIKLPLVRSVLNGKVSVTTAPDQGDQVCA